MNYNNYSSTGIDKPIKIIQNNMSDKLGFSNVDFYGRVQKVLAKDGNGYTPEVHISNFDRKEVFYNDLDAIGGNVFFVDSDDHTTKNGIIWTAKVKIVFMLNIDKLIPNKDYRVDSEIQSECVKLVKKLGMLNITSLEKGLENVLNDFNRSGIIKNDMQPYHTFAIVGNLDYNFNC